MYYVCSFNITYIIGGLIFVSGEPIKVQNLKDGTVRDKPLDIYLYLNKMGLVLFYYRYSLEEKEAFSQIKTTKNYNDFLDIAEVSGCCGG